MLPKIKTWIWIANPTGPVYCVLIGSMSSYENIVGGKLKLKGKALDVKAGGMKKKKKRKKNQDQIAQVVEDDLSAGWLISISYQNMELVCRVVQFIRFHLTNVTI